ncbi:MAG: hypothetical protein F6K42_23185 [Leptolyngbya sp. SIO1D8]|nr:hypothetical protein [Leptolyngbya sp. SIO1D8]
MAFFRSYIAPLLIVLTFLIAMLAVSARIFLPSDMMAPAPLDDSVGLVAPQTSPTEMRIGNDILEVSWFLQGLPDGIS